MKKVNYTMSFMQQAKNNLDRQLKYSVIYYNFLGGGKDSRYEGGNPVSLQQGVVCAHTLFLLLQVEQERLVEVVH